MADKREVQRQIDRISDLKSKRAYPDEFEPWRAQTERVLAQVFGETSLQVTQFRGIHYGPVIVSTSDTDAVFDNHYHRGLSEAKMLLASFIEDLDESKGGSEKNVLTCPQCKAVEVDYLELRPSGATEIQGGLHLFGGRKKNIKTLAYYRCRICNNVFSIEPVKSGENESVK